MPFGHSPAVDAPPPAAPTGVAPASAGAATTAGSPASSSRNASSAVMSISIFALPSAEAAAGGAGSSIAAQPAATSGAPRVAHKPIGPMRHCCTGAPEFERSPKPTWRSDSAQLARPNGAGRLSLRCRRSRASHPSPLAPTLPWGHLVAIRVHLVGTGGYTGGQQGSKGCAGLISSVGCLFKMVRGAQLNSATVQRAAARASLAFGRAAARQRVYPYCLDTS